MIVKPLVSVIIPTYNRAKIICQTIDNVFDQSYANLELILVDDGSTDDTIARLNSYGTRITVIPQANAGPAAARNRGVAASHGEIIAFQDSDDLWKPTKLENQVRLLGEAGDSVPCCLSNAEFGVINGKQITSFDISSIDTPHMEGLWTNVTEVLATRFVLFNQTVAIRRSAIRKVGVFNERLKYLEDYDLPLRLADEGPWAYTKEPLVIYREGTANSFSQQALRDPIVLKQCEISIFESALARAQKSGDSESEWQIERRLKTFKRFLVAERLSQSRSLLSRVEGRAINRLEHYKNMLFTKSPWFPKAKTVPLKGSNNIEAASTAQRCAPKDVVPFENRI
jgi:glycosyltransferase involved in cell wall biosynthesis